MHRQLLPLALVVPLALAPQAGAATPGPQQAAFVLFDLKAAHHTYEVHLLGAVPLVSGPADLQLMVRDVTTGGDTAGYDGALPAQALTITDAGAWLRTQVAGLPLTVTWTPSSGVGAGGDEVGGDGPPSTGYLVAGRTADVTLAFGEARCTPSVFGMLGYAATDAAADSAPLAKAFAGVDLHGATCGDVDGYVSAP